MRLLRNGLRKQSLAIRLPLRIDVDQNLRVGEALAQRLLGAVEAVKHLQNIMPGIAGPIMGQPEIYLNGVGDAFDDKGQLTKEPVQKVLQQYIDAFAAFVEKQNK